MPLTISDLQTIDYYLKTVIPAYFKNSKLKIAFEYKGHICTGDFLIMYNTTSTLVRKERIINGIGQYEVTAEDSDNLKEINSVKSHSLKDPLIFKLNSTTRSSESIFLFQKYLSKLVERNSEINNLPNVIYNLSFLDSPSIPVFPSVNVSDDEIKFISIYPTADPDSDEE